MKYFTREWVNGDLSEGEWSSVTQNYLAYLASVADQLPSQILELAFHTNLHDGLIQKAVLSIDNRQLELVVTCGDLQTGYFDVTLVYFGVTITPENWKSLEEAASNPKTEFLYDELEVMDKKYAHRILFWPRNEVEFWFLNIDITKLPKGKRKI